MVAFSNFSNLRKVKILALITVIFIVAHFVMVRRSGHKLPSTYDYKKDVDKILASLEPYSEERSKESNEQKRIYEMRQTTRQRVERDHNQNIQSSTLPFQRNVIYNEGSSENDNISLKSRHKHQNTTRNQDQLESASFESHRNILEDDQLHNNLNATNTPELIFRKHALPHLSVNNSKPHYVDKSWERSSNQSQFFSQSVPSVSRIGVKNSSSVGKNKNQNLLLDKPLLKHMENYKNLESFENGLYTKDEAVRVERIERFHPNKCLLMSPIVVRSEGKFNDRVSAYNAAISRLRSEILAVRGAYSQWKDIVKPENLTVIWGANDDFLSKLCERPEARMIMLPWSVPSQHFSNWSSLTDNSNLLQKSYYQWTGSETLCLWISTRGFTKARFDTVYNGHCDIGPPGVAEKINEDGSTASARSLEYIYLNYKTVNPQHYWPHDGDAYPDWFHTAPPPYVFYLHLVQDAVINSVGDVIAGSVKIVPYTCSHDPLPTIPQEYPQRPIYAEVFVLTQFWGTTYFHKLMEVMPRIAPYIEFLRSNPSVHIHAPEDRSRVSEYLDMFGINPERVVTGIVRAKVVYLPQGTPCGFPLTLSLQILSQLFRSYIHQHLVAPEDIDSTHAQPHASSNSEEMTSSPHTARRTLVYVRRSGTRRFDAQAAMDEMLSRVAEDFQLEYVVFADNPSPSLTDTMKIFYSALVVVGPHGAGLSNIVFSGPGALVVEGVCNPPHVNLCYQMAAHGLGMRYHGLGSRGGCERVVEVDPESMEKVLRAYIPLVQKEEEKVR